MIQWGGGVGGENKREIAGQIIAFSRVEREKLVVGEWCGGGVLLS